MRSLVFAVVFLVFVAGCSGDAADAPVEETVSADDCIVRLHGKGGTGASTEVVNDVAIVSPTGNGEAWDAHQWEYASAEALSAATGIVATAIDAVGCSAVSIHGFSNGGSFAAKLACSGEDFGSKLRGVVVDDPVTDLSSADCAPAGGVEMALYWTGALAATAPAGTNCGDIDWTCEGGSTLGIEAYARALGTPVQASPHDDHRWNVDAPEPEEWLSE